MFFIRGIYECMKLGPFTFERSLSDSGHTEFFVLVLFPFVWLNIDGK